MCEKMKTNQKNMRPKLYYDPVWKQRGDL